MTIIQNATKINPSQDYIVVKPFEPVQYSGSLELPDSAKNESPSEGEVLESGPECSWVKASDRVIFKRYAGTQVSIDGVSVLLMQQSDVVGFPN